MDFSTGKVFSRCFFLSLFKFPVVFLTLGFEYFIYIHCMFMSCIAATAAVTIICAAIDCDIVFKGIICSINGEHKVNVKILLPMVKPFLVIRQVSKKTTKANTHIFGYLVTGLDCGR